MREALTRGLVRVEEIWIAEGRRARRMEEVLRMAEDKKIPVRTKKPGELSRIFPGLVHQGIVAKAERFTYTSLDHLVALSLKKPGRALLIAADHITDEGNLGALMRTGAFFGAHGLIVPKDRSASVTPRVLKRSSGAYMHLPVARVVNIRSALDLLDKKGFWIVGTSGDSAVSIHTFDWRRDLVLVMGSEDRGMSRSIRQRCHEVLSIPSGGAVEALNVAVAAGAVLSEIYRQRHLSTGRP